MEFKIGDIVKLNIEVSDRCDSPSNQAAGCVIGFEDGIGSSQCMRVRWVESPFIEASNLVYSSYIRLYDRAL